MLEKTVRLKLKQEAKDAQAVMRAKIEWHQRRQLELKQETEAQRGLSSIPRAQSRRGKPLCVGLAPQVAARHQRCIGLRPTPHAAADAQREKRPPLPASAIGAPRKKRPSPA